MGEANKQRKLMDDKRQNIQLVLAFEEEDRGEARTALEKGPKRSRRSAGQKARQSSNS